MTNAMSSSQRASVTLGLIGAFIAIVATASWPYIPQFDPPSYFNFADQRSIFGIPHFFDVSSNLFFIYISLFSMFFGIKRRYFMEKRIFESFLLMNLMVFLTGWGSSYFHLYPRPQTIFWDRLPMAMGFASLLTLVLVDRVVFYYHRGILLSLNILGFWSVWKIDYGDMDIRTYLLVQFGSLMAVIFILLSFRRGHIRRIYIWLGLLLYTSARACEYYDHQIFDFTGSSLSGHTIKHLFAALAILSLNIGVLTSGRQHVGS